MVDTFQEDLQHFYCVNCKANLLLCLTTKSIVKYIIVLNEFFYGMYECISFFFLDSLINY